MFAENPSFSDNHPDTQEWERHQYARLAIMMLDRLDVSPDDEHRVRAIAIMVRKLGNLKELPYEQKEIDDCRASYQREKERQDPSST
jgi:hypothetical protein